MAQYFLPEFGMIEPKSDCATFLPEFGMNIDGLGGGTPPAPEGPTMNQLLRHGTWFADGVKQPMSW